MDNTPLHILLVEDNSTDVLLLREALGNVRTTRFELCLSKRLDEAAKWLDVQRFDAVLLDLGLPDSQGIATFDALHLRHSSVPIIVLSGLDDESLAVKAVAAGAQDYVVKGTFTGSMLALTIRYAIERKRTDTALRESEERYRALAEAAPDDIFIISRDGAFQYINNKDSQRFGLPAVKGNGNRDAEMFVALMANPGTGPPRTTQPGVDMVFLSADPTYHEVHMPPEAGEVWQGLWLVPLKNKFGEIHAMMGFGRDISAQKKAEATLLASEARYRALFESNPQPMWVYDLETFGILAVNDAATLHYGYSRAEFFAMTEDQLLMVPNPPADSASPAGQLTPASETGTWHQTKDGTVIEVELRTHEFIFNGRGARLALAHDITARKEAGRALQTANENLELRVLERTSELGRVNLSLRLENAQHQKTMAVLSETADALQAAKDEADAANAAKSDFLSRMSHELRTPLNAILGFGQMLELEDLNPGEKENVGHILKGGWHLLDLINEVLDITRVESGHLELSVEPIALDDVVPEACALLRPLAAERKIRLEDHSSELGRSYILADRLRLKQVLINLIGNAIKYNRREGEVVVSCIPSPGGWTTIAVRDTGPGISPEDLPKLFMPFERFSAAASEVEGTGLGLVLSQRLMKAMGGILKVESTLGKGTTFTIGFPHAESPENQIVESLELQALPVAKQPLRCFTVLCIEDNPSNLRLLEVIFRARPAIELLTAMQGSVGLDLARQHRPDLILLDLNLPDLNGIEVLARLKQSSGTCNIPVVVISADATASQIRRLLAAGATEYLTKPLEVPKVLETLDKILLPEGV